MIEEAIYSVVDKPTKEEEKSKFSIDYSPPVFGWFLLFRAARAVVPTGGYWFLHALFYTFRFFLMIIPAFIIDLITSGTGFILAWIYRVSESAIKKLISKIIDTSFDIVKRIISIIVIVLILISLVTDFQTWKHFSNRLFHWFLSFL